MLTCRDYDGMVRQVYERAEEASAREAIAKDFVAGKLYDRALDQLASGHPDDWKQRRNRKEDAGGAKGGAQRPVIHVATHALPTGIAADKKKEKKQRPKPKMLHEIAVRPGSFTMSPGARSSEPADKTSESPDATSPAPSLRKRAKSEIPSPEVPEAISPTPFHPIMQHTTELLDSIQHDNDPSDPEEERGDAYIFNPFTLARKVWPRDSVDGP